MDAVVQVLQEKGPMRRDALIQWLGSGHTPDDIDSELRNNKEQGLIELDADGYWGLTAAGATLAS